MRDSISNEVSIILGRALAGYTEDYKYHATDGRTYIQWGKVEQDIRVAIERWETMPDMTTTEAAAYLAEHGYTVRSKRDGTDKPPNSTTIKQWCERGKIKARKSGWVWLVSQDELDRLLGAIDSRIDSSGDTPRKQ